MISAYVVPTMKHEGGMMAWGCLASDSLIYLKYNAHLTSMATTAFCSDTPVPLSTNQMGYPFVFQQDNDPKPTSRLCKGYLTKKESDGVLHQMT